MSETPSNPPVWAADPVPPVDNDYFVQWERGQLSAPLIPWRGKHAVSTERFFDHVNQIQIHTMPEHWCYRPLKVEVEITHRCDQACPHCGVASNSAPSSSDPVLSEDELFALPAKLNRLGIPGVSITGGEPFLDMPRLLTLLDRCRGLIDVVKITTNAGSSGGSARGRILRGALRSAIILLKTRALPRRGGTNQPGA